MRGKKDRLAALVGHFTFVVMAHEGIGEEIVVEACGVIFRTGLCPCSAVS